jgi:uncharacterized protein YjbJ (UPF0337 family)
MNTSTGDKIAGSLTGTIKEETRKIADDCKLRLEGILEKNAGKFQRQIGHAKEAVAQLKDALASISKDGNAS